MRCLSARIPIHDPARLDQEACARFPLHIYIPFWLSLSQPRLRFPPQIPYYTEFRGISLEQVITITFWKLIMRSRIENYRRCTVSRYTVVCRRFDERYVTFSSEWVAELNDETIIFLFVIRNFSRVKLHIYETVRTNYRNFRWKFSTMFGNVYSVSYYTIKI